MFILKTILEKWKLKPEILSNYNIFCTDALEKMYMGSSTETVAFQVYEILKINHEYLQFF